MKKRLKRVAILFLALTASSSLIWHLWARYTTTDDLTAQSPARNPAANGTYDKPQTPDANKQKTTKISTATDSSGSYNQEIRDTFFAASDYLDFIRRYEAMAADGNSYARYFIGAAYLTCNILEFSLLPKDPKGKPIFERSQVEARLWNDLSKSKAELRNHEWMKLKYDRCERLYQDSSYAKMDRERLMADMENSGHPDTLVLKAQEHVQEGKLDPEGRELLEMAFASKEGSTIAAASGVLLSLEQSSSFRQAPLVREAWQLAACHYGDDCSPNSDLMLETCLTKPCSARTNFKAWLEREYSREQVANIERIHARLISQIENGNLDAIIDGQYFGK